MIVEHGLSGLPFVLSEALGRALGVSKLPYAVLLDEQGKVAQRESLFLGTTAGPILHGDGATWRSTSGPLARVSAVWGLSTGEAFAATAKGVLYRDGGTWRPMPGTESFELSAIWGLGARDVYAVGMDTAPTHTCTA